MRIKTGVGMKNIARTGIGWGGVLAAVLAACASAPGTETPGTPASGLSPLPAAVASEAPLAAASVSASAGASASASAVLPPSPPEIRLEDVAADGRRRIFIVSPALSLRKPLLDHDVREVCSATFPTHSSQQQRGLAEQELTLLEVQCGGKRGELRRSREGLLLNGALVAALPPDRPIEVTEAPMRSDWPRCSAGEQGATLRVTHRSRPPAQPAPPGVTEKELLLVVGEHALPIEESWSPVRWGCRMLGSGAKGWFQGRCRYGLSSVDVSGFLREGRVEVRVHNGSQMGGSLTLWTIPVPCGSKVDLVPWRHRRSDASPPGCAERCFERNEECRERCLLQHSDGDARPTEGHDPCVEACAAPTDRCIAACPPQGSGPPRGK